MHCSEHKGLLVVTHSDLQKNSVVDNWARASGVFSRFPKELTKLAGEFIGVLTSTNSRIVSGLESGALTKTAFDKIGVDLTSCRLLFRGSDDGFSAERFHELCDNKGATLTVALTEFGHVIGFFTNVPWQSGGGIKHDIGAWLFVARANAKRHSLNLPAILKAQSSQYTHMCHESCFGPTFGGGCDLLLADDCHSNSDSFCYSGGHTFTNVCDDTTVGTLTITGGPVLDAIGRSNFRVVDYEVYIPSNSCACKKVSASKDFYR